MNIATGTCRKFSIFVLLFLQAFLSGKLKLSGNIMLAQKLGEILNAVQAKL